MFCGNCGTYVEDHNVCTDCGNKNEYFKKIPIIKYTQEKAEERTCKKCGAIVPVDSAFCGKCGTQYINENQVRNPHCVICEEVLLNSANYCIACGTKYKRSNNGYIDLLDTSVCSKCGAVNKDNTKYCTKCGNIINAYNSISRRVPCCYKCDYEIDPKMSFCINCGQELIKVVFPIIRDGKYVCPKCGASNQPTNRKCCFECGVAFAK